MTLKALLISDQPGHGVVHIAGLAPAPAAEVEIALQRSLDEKYLGQNRQWQTTPHWHCAERVERGPDALRLWLGPEIIDSVVAASNMPLRLWTRIDEVEDFGVLRIKGRLLGSSAAATPAPAPEPPSEPTPHSEEVARLAAIEADMRRQEQEELARRHAEDQRREQARRERQAEAQRQQAAQRRARLVRLLLVLLLVLLLGVGIAGWWFGWFERWWEPTADSVEIPPPVPTEPVEPTEPLEPPPVTAPPPPPPVLEPEPEPTPPPASTSTPLGGRAGVQTYLQDEPAPSPQAMFEKAQEQEQLQDCEAAMLLYGFAANADPDLALALAQRYDPDMSQTSGCIGTSDPETAAYWYENPAKAGNTVAQRQLGKILTADPNATAAIYEYGLDWLQKAAAAGDAEAQALLAERADPSSTPEQ